MSSLKYLNVQKWKSSLTVPFEPSRKNHSHMISHGNAWINFFFRNRKHIRHKMMEWDRQRRYEGDTQLKKTSWICSNVAAANVTLTRVDAHLKLNCICNQTNGSYIPKKASATIAEEEEAKPQDNAAFNQNDPKAVSCKNQRERNIHEILGENVGHLLVLMLHWGWRKPNIDDFNETKFPT